MTDDDRRYWEAASLAALTGLLAWPEGAPMGSSMDEHTKHYAYIAGLYANAILDIRRDTFARRGM